MLANLLTQISMASLQSEIRLFFFFHLTQFKLLSLNFQKMWVCLSTFIGSVRAVESFFFVLLSVLWLTVMSLALKFDMGASRSFCCAELTAEGY